MVSATAERSQFSELCSGRFQQFFVKPADGSADILLAGFFIFCPVLVWVPRVGVLGRPGVFFFFLFPADYSVAGEMPSATMLHARMTFKPSPSAAAITSTESVPGFSHSSPQPLAAMSGSTLSSTGGGR